MDLPGDEPPFPSTRFGSQVDGAIRSLGDDSDMTPQQLEAKLVQVKDRLEDCVVEQRRRLETILKRQQQALDACVRHLGIIVHDDAEAQVIMPMRVNGTSHQMPGILPVEPVYPSTGSSPSPQKSDAVGSERRLTASDRRFAWVCSESTAASRWQTTNFEKTALRCKTKKLAHGITSLARHHHFDHMVGAILLLNAVFVCIQADFSARRPGEKQPLEFDIMETVFFALIFGELVLRMCNVGSEFIFGPEWRWNWFDIVVVLTAGLEQAFKLIRTDLRSNMTFLRVMRIIKITRIIRIIRVVRIFRELRIMVTSIVSTIRTLFWSIVCLFMIMSGVGVYLATAVSDYQAEHGTNPEMATYFGSMPGVIVSLFQATTGGMDWIILSDLLGQVSILPQFVLFGYISMMMYAIMNILTGICVTTANRSAEEDMEITINEELTKHNSAISSLQRIFHDHDVDGNGQLTLSRLTRHLKDKTVRTYFKKLDLEPWHLQRFFDILRAYDEEPSIGIDQFMRGCLRLRCNVKNIDLMAAGHEETRQNVKHYDEFKRAVAGMLNEESARNTKRHVQLQVTLSQLLATLAGRGDRRYETTNSPEPDEFDRCESRMSLA